MLSLEEINLQTKIHIYLSKEKEGKVHLTKTLRSDGKLNKICTKRYSSPSKTNQFTNNIGYVTCSSCLHCMLWGNMISHEEYVKRNKTAY